MSQYSIKAYNEILDSLPEKRKQVYMTLSKYPNSSFYDISYKLGWNVNKVSNRFNELQNAGLIVKTGTETRGKFERELFSIVTDKESIINKQNELYSYFTDCKSQLEEDYLRCETKEGKSLIRKRIDYMKTKISNLKLIAARSIL